MRFASSPHLDLLLALRKGFRVDVVSQNWLILAVVHKSSRTVVLYNLNNDVDLFRRQLLKSLAKFDLFLVICMLILFFVNFVLIVLPRLLPLGYRNRHQRQIIFHIFLKKSFKFVCQFPDPRSVSIIGLAIVPNQLNIIQALLHQLVFKLLQFFLHRAQIHRVLDDRRVVMQSQSHVVHWLTKLSRVWIVNQVLKNRIQSLIFIFANKGLTHKLINKFLSNFS